MFYIPLSRERGAAGDFRAEKSPVSLAETLGLRIFAVANETTVMKQRLCGYVKMAAGLLLCATMTFCSGKAGGKPAAAPSRPSGQTETPRAGTEQEDAFPFPTIPETMTEPQERRSFLLLHYWDNYDFADTALLRRPEVTEQGLVNYVALAGSHPDEAEVGRALDVFCGRLLASEEAAKEMPALMEKYLYDPMSPMPDEALYARFLDALLAHVPADDARRGRWTFLRALLGRNNPGQRAENFTYYLPDGQRRTLAETPVNAPVLLLFFYDPECENCHATLQEMKANDALAEAVRSGRAQVLAVYTEGNPGLWRARLDEIPAGWTVGADREQIKTEALYDLKAMPSLYLLDADRRVLLKDASFGRICEAMGW